MMKRMMCAHKFGDKSSKMLADFLVYKAVASAYVQLAAFTSVIQVINKTLVVINQSHYQMSASQRTSDDNTNIISHIIVI